MITSWFSRRHNANTQEETFKKEYATVSGIAELIELGRDQNSINGILLDFEGREFEFKVSHNGDLLSLTGVKEDLPFVWNVCVSYLQKKYGRNDIDIVRHEMRKMHQELRETIEELSSDIEELSSDIEDLSEEIAEIELPEVIQPFEAPQVIEKIEDFIPQAVQEEPDYEEQDIQSQLEDFSDEDLAQHALKVLNGEITIDA